MQTVSDALHARGPSTLHDLVAYIRHHCLKDWNEERGRLVDRLNGLMVNGGNNGITTSTGGELHHRGGKVKMNKARGNESAGFVTEASHVRAALIVLLQHSLIKVSGGNRLDMTNEHDANNDGTRQKNNTHYTYTFLVERARMLPRYPRYIEHVQNIMDDNAAQIVECILENGRMRGEDVICSAWEDAKKRLQSEGGEDNDNDDADGSESFKALKNIVQSFQRLVEGGYVEMVQPIASSHDLDENDGINGGEVEFTMVEEEEAVEKLNSSWMKKKGRSSRKAKKRTRSNSSDGTGGRNQRSKKSSQTMEMLAIRKKTVIIRGYLFFYRRIANLYQPGQSTASTYQCSMPRFEQ